MIVGSTLGDFIVAGMSDVGGFNYAQLRLLGVETPPKSGWKNRIIGKMIPKSVAQKYLDMKGKSNHYLEYKIKKDGIQPIENDRGMPSTRAEGLSVNENTTHAQLNKIITQKEKK